jgi:hypothetical protein
MRPGFPSPPVSVARVPGPHRVEGCTKAAKAHVLARHNKTRFINGIDGVFGEAVVIVLAFPVSD